jgi:hypothetical protein
MPFNANPTGDNVATPQHTSDTPHRRVLGDVSPNVKPMSTTPAFLKKAPTSSPLKRSFTATMDGGEGFTYLKKRKLTDDETLSQTAGVQESFSQDENGLPVVQSSQFRPIFQSTDGKVVSPSYHFIHV